MSDTYTAAADSPDLLWVFDKATDKPIGIATPDGEVVRFGEGGPGTTGGVSAAAVSAAIDGFNGAQVDTAWARLKPSAGIPSGNLDAAVRAALTAAGTAIQPAALAPVSAAAAAAQTNAATALASVNVIKLADVADDAAALAAVAADARGNGSTYYMVNVGANEAPAASGGISQDQLDALATIVATKAPSADLTTTNSRVTALEAAQPAGTRRGTTAVMALLNALAWAGGDTSSLVPLGNYNVATFAELQTAVAAATAGQIVRINDRAAITATAQLAVKEGVSLVAGGGVTYVSGYTPAGATQADAALLLLSSATEGANGNQTIENIAFLGNGYQASGAIYVRARSNVKIKNCTAQEFNWNFCTFNGKNTDANDTPTATKATGNGVYNCAATACCLWIGPKDTSGYASGIVQFGNQSGFELRNTILAAKGRGAQNEGYPVKFYRNGFNQGTVIDNCSLRKGYEDGTPGFFIFCGELWHEVGLTISNTYHEGRFDINGLTKGTYPFALRYSNNSSGTATMPSSAALGSAIALELALDATSCSDILIENSFFKNIWQAVYVYQKTGAGSNKFARVVVNNCKFVNTRLADWNAQTNTEGGTDDWNVTNCTLRRLSGAPALNAGIWMPNFGANTNWQIRRCVVSGFGAPVSQGAQGGTTSNVTIKDNLFNGNTSDAISWTVTPTGLTVGGNSTATPMWDTEDATSTRHAYNGTIGANEYVGLTAAF